MRKVYLHLSAKSWSARILTIVLLAPTGIHVWYEFRTCFGAGTSHNSLQSNLFSFAIAVGFYIVPIFIAFISVQHRPISILSHTIVWLMVSLSGYILYVHAFVSVGSDKGVLLFILGLIYWVFAFLAALSSGKSRISTKQH